MMLEVTQSTNDIKCFWFKAVSGIAGATVEDETCQEVLTKCSMYD